MPGERPNISMTPQEAADFLRLAQDLVVAYSGPGGWPIGFTADVDYSEGVITATFADPTGTAAEAGEGDSVCCIAEESPNYEEIRGVIVQGQIAAISEQAGSWQWTVHPRRTTSFDFARFRKAGRSDKRP